MRSRHVLRAPRAGFTLIELLVVLAIIATGASIAALTMRAPPPAQPAGMDGQVAELRRHAIETGAIVNAVLTDSSGIYAAVALPDGSVIADQALHVDRRTGRRVLAAH
jgi:prepilin-type N-terminal cleavage/methylation domain